MDCFFFGCVSGGVKFGLMGDAQLAIALPARLLNLAGHINIAIRAARKNLLASNSSAKHHAQEFHE